MSNKSHHVAVVIVGFCNANDVSNCLNALAVAAPSPSFDIFICENGGAESFQELIDVLTAAQGPCETPQGDLAIPNDSSRVNFKNIKCLTLKRRSTLVWTACATQNLGYAGAINAWIEQLKGIPDWDGMWILNPDTQAHPNALAELVQRAVTGNKGMVSSALVNATGDRVHNRGLSWRKFLASAISIGFQTSVGAYDLEWIESTMDSPSGASMYATRTAVDRVGPMDERFFLYFEDLDWGIRAKKLGLGHAAQSIVFHEGGTTIGKSSSNRANKTALSVYLESRNRILFVQKHYPRLSVYTGLLSLAYASLYLLAGSPGNFKIALQGILAAWAGEKGAPSISWNGHLRAILSNIPTAMYRKAKLAISLAYYCGGAIWRAALGLVRCPPVPRLTILYYHAVDDNDRFEFARQMDVLLDKARVVPADFRGTLSPNKANVAITFDDAYESVVNNALPELALRSFHSTIFAPVGMLGKKPNWFMEASSSTSHEVVMSAARLKVLSPALVDLGSHGVFHLNLRRVSRDRAESEIVQSRHRLKELVDREVSLFAFPYGEYDEWLVECCKAAGYRHAYTSRLSSIDVTKSGFLRGRVKVDMFDSALEFFLKIHGGYNWLPVIAKARGVLSEKNSNSMSDNFLIDGGEGEWESPHPNHRPTKRDGSKSTPA